jgi:MSHA biogenesis protein MshJ
MIETLTRFAERIDNLSLRQRVIIFFALALVLTFAVNRMLIEPLRARDKVLAADMAQQHSDLATLQAQVQRMVQGNAADPDAENRGRRNALRDEMRRLNTRIVEEQRRFTPPDRMRGVLGELLERNRNLALIDLKTLPVVPVAGQRLGATGGMYRHGIELTVRGSYDELYEYLRALEKLPSQLYWSRAELSVDAHPALILKLTVHTLSFDRAWLVV